MVRFNFQVLWVAALASTTFLSIYQYMRLYSGSDWKGAARNGSNCHCHPAELKSSDTFKSLCGWTADNRGPGQRVISFSLFGDVQKYVAGIRGNILDLKAKYPKGYTARIYHDSSWERDPNQMNLLCQVYCDYSDMMDLCPVQKLHSPASGWPLLPKFGMVWRFAPMADEFVTEFHSRDLDSRPTDREFVMGQIVTRISKS